MKILEENIGRKISEMSPRARDIKVRINKWKFIKIKSFCEGKETSAK